MFTTRQTDTVLQAGNGTPFMSNVAVRHLSERSLIILFVNLAIDIGNTRTKAGVFNDRQMVNDFVIPGKPLIDEFRDWVKTHGVQNAIISTTKTLEPGFVTSAQEVTQVVFLSASTSLPIVNAYDSPETLGADRICGVVAGAARFPGENVLVIDAGTCITYDVIDHQGVYRGGAISPGLRMRLNSMSAFTDKLPLLAFSGVLENIGTSTASCMHFGAERGALTEVSGFIRHFESLYANLKVILTGGDHSFFEQHVENVIFAAPNLILEGLNEILLFNKQR